MNQSDFKILKHTQTKEECHLGKFPWIKEFLDKISKNINIIEQPTTSSWFFVYFHL
jgi:hypothetical protein